MLEFCTALHRKGNNQEPLPCNQGQPALPLYSLAIPAIISAILLLVLILTVITNIITQVVKKVTRNKLPTNVLVILVAMGLTLCAFFAMCQIMGWIVLWYMLAAAIVVGFFVAFAAMFGFDKFRQTLEQITHLEK